MATSSSPTFDEVDKHIQAADLAAIQPGGKHFPAAAAGAVPAALPNICPAYKIVRPILVLASNTPIIPQKWRDAIKAFIAVMDVICP
jgi:hypothetical protein